MGSIANVPVYQPGGSKAKSGFDATSTKDLSQNFLRMLTEQLKNQDPMNPMDNAAMTSQLAALNTVDGINRLNTSMSSLVAQMQSANFLNLSNSVGKSALAAGDQIYFTGQAVSLGASIDKPAKSLKASILDAAGNTVRSLDLGPQDSGTIDFIWDGRDGQGKAAPTDTTYTLRLEATDAADAVISPKSLIGAAVAAIGKEGEAIKALLSDGRKVAVDDIVKWLAI